MVRTRIRVFDFADLSLGLRDWNVRACSPQSVECEVWAQGRTDEEGYVTLDIVLPRLSTQPPEFEGYFLFDGGPGFLPYAFHSSAPVLDGSDIELAQVPKSTIEGFYESFRQPLSPELALLYVQPFDCRGLGATKVRVEAWIADGTEYRPCEGACGVLYQSNVGIPDGALTEIDARGQLAFVYGVAARETAVLVRDVESNEIVGALHITARAGHAQLVSIFPGTASQLRGVPVEAR